MFVFLQALMAGPSTQDVAFVHYQGVTRVTRRLRAADTGPELLSVSDYPDLDNTSFSMRPEADVRGRRVYLPRSGSRRYPAIPLGKPRSGRFLRGILHVSWTRNIVGTHNAYRQVTSR